MAIQIRQEEDYSQEQYSYSAEQQNQQLQYNQNGAYQQQQVYDDNSANMHAQDSQSYQLMQPVQMKTYQYDKVGNLQVGKGWLMDRDGKKQTTGVRYRECILQAMFQARDKFVKRKKEEGKSYPKSIMGSPNDYHNQNMKTVNPDIPEFSIKRKMTKFGGVCGGKNYDRFFTVDEDNFQYFVGSEVAKPKKSLLIKGSEAFIQNKEEHSRISKQDKNAEGVEVWAQPNEFFRVGIKLKDRPSGPVYFYTSDIQEAKFLFVNIRLHGDPYKKKTISNKIQMLQNIERITRFQKVIQMLCFAKEKRFVQMHQFQLLSLQMVEIAQQSKKFQARTLQRWFSNMLDDDEDIVKIRSAFRTKPPIIPDAKQQIVFNEDVINRDIKALKTFISRRKINRSNLINQEINKQLYEESTGITVQSLILTEYDAEMQKTKRVLDIKNNQAALMFDNEQSYKYMTIENKQLYPNNMHSGGPGGNRNKRARQAQDLMRKLDLGDVSFISTDLHQNNQFDFNNKIHPQSDYSIRIFGPIRRMKPARVYPDDEILPSEIGLDCIRMSKPNYTVQIRKITFPPGLANQEMKKITLNVKLYQFRNKQMATRQNVAKKQHCYEMTSKCFHLKNVNTGELFGDGEQFHLNKLSNQEANDEVFAIGVIIRQNRKPIPRVTEKYMTQQKEIRSFDGRQPQFFTFDKLTQEQKVFLQDERDPNFKCTVSFALNLTNQQVEPIPQVTERSGKRLLVGKYVLLQGSRPCYVKSLSGNGQIKVCDIFLKKDYLVGIDQVKLIEQSGVNVFQMDQEPAQIQQCEFDWQVQIMTNDKRLLNQIASKIQIRQTFRQNQQQDTFTRDDYSSISGKLIVSVLETKGLILPQEMNRRNIDPSLRLDPVVEIRLETFSKQILESYSSQPVTNRRQIIFGTHQNKAVADQIGDFQVDLGMISHSGKVYNSQDEMNYNSENNLYTQESEKYIHFLVKDNKTQQDLGSAKIIIDELIDTNLYDLAKEFCVCINRQHIIKQMIDSGKYPKDIEMFTQFSGIIKFQTFFQPTQDTCLRFQKLRDTQNFNSPKQLLHFEHLLERNDFDEIRFKIPQTQFNPNNKSIGEDQIDLQNLIDQCDSAPQVQQFFLRLQNKEEEDQMSIVRQTAKGNQKLSEELFKQIDQTIKFQSPFEQVYIILKLQRKERPLVEPIFFQLKNMWDIHIQNLKNQAFNQLTYNEWRSFLDQNEIQEQIAKEPGEDKVFDFESILAKSAMDISDDLTQKSFIQEQHREATQNVQALMRKSTLHAERLDENQILSDFSKDPKKKKRSLIPTLLWESEDKQEFTDLVNLVKSGVPSILRPFVWSELLCSKIYEKQQKRLIIQQPDRFPKKLISKQSLFLYFLDISLKYDCIAFRQIDQDILDFKFPANYYEETGADNSQFKAPTSNVGENDKEFKLSRQNKMKQDKQKMRKLMRILIVWGKTFIYGKTLEQDGEEYQYSYTTGFLKFVHRIINIMTLEDAFLIIVSMMRQQPRLFCLNNSSMLGDGKSNFRFEMGAFRAILQANFPSVFKKLLDFGISVESLVYESIQSLYSDMFHTETLLRIWDQIIFYMVTDNDLPEVEMTQENLKPRKAIWQIFAPALYVISKKREQILKARTVQEIFLAYKDGCGINYNPNQVIEEIYDLIDEIFITEGQRKTVQKEMSKTSLSSTTGGTGSLVEVQQEITANQGILSGIFSGTFFATKMSGNKMDEIRRGFHKKFKIMNDNQRVHNTIVNEFLFNTSNQRGDKSGGDGDTSMAFPGSKNNFGIMKRQDDYMDDEVDHQKGMRLLPYQLLDYKKWRQEIVPSLSTQLLGNDDMIDDDLFDFEDVEIFKKKSLDIKVIHIYLHDLDHYFGDANGDMSYIVQIQYGQRKKGGKFEVKHFTREEDPEARMNGCNLQYYWHFKYTAGYNMIKVKMMSVDMEPICKCYIDLHGYQRGKFIHLKKPMNSKEFTHNGESKFPLIQLKMSLLLQRAKDKGDQNDIDMTKTIFQYSMKKYNPTFMNIYQYDKEKKFQDFMQSDLQQSVEFDYVNFDTLMQNQEVAIDTINSKYNYIDVKPEDIFGHLDENNFKFFMTTCFNNQYDNISFNEKNNLYKKFILGDTKKDSKLDVKNLKKVAETEPSQVVDLYSKWADLDVENVGQNSLVAQLGNKITTKSLSDPQAFSTRAFIINSLLQSQITVKEKLDVIYDLTNQSNKFVDGIDLHDALMIYDTILRDHLYYIPYNELRTQVERVFNQGIVSGIIGAYWTMKDSGQIKFDMQINDTTGYCTLDHFLNSGYFQNKNQFQIIDCTTEVQTTFQMYINMFGNKILDFNDDISPFKSLNNILAGNGIQNLGSELITRTNKVGGKNYRLCIISIISGGERHLTELFYDLSTYKLKVPDEKQPFEEQRFKKFFQRNINILDLQGKHTSITKAEFMEGTLQIPFVADLMRAETFWQDRKFLVQQGQHKMKKMSLRQKQKFQPTVFVFMSDKDNVFIFKFEKAMVPRTERTTISQVSKNFFMFDIQALNLEDIVLDMRDRITNELLKIERKGYINIQGRDRDMNFKFSDNFIKEVDGKMEFFVRKVFMPEKQRNSIGGPNQEPSNYVWQWVPLNDFDRMEKFADEEVFEDEVIFKLINTSGEDAVDIEEYKDDKPQHIIDGYDCFSIYKHQDNSYEWRLCKIIKTELKPEFKHLAMQAFQELGQRHSNLDNSSSNLTSGYSQAVQEQEKYFYYLEFEHLKEYGEEMWVKRRREDIIFSSRYARDQSNFEKQCFQFIVESYKDNNQIQ